MEVLTKYLPQTGSEPLSNFYIIHLTIVNFFIPLNVK